MHPKRILFVCTGNSCRSVMAEWVMRHTLQQAGIDSVTVESAGVFAVEGMGATQEAQRVTQEAGIDVSAHRAKGLTSELAEAADLIFVMETYHGEEIARRAPKAAGKIHLLKPYGLPSGQLGANIGIPDPIGKPLEVYEVCFTDIRDAVSRIAKSLGVSAA